MMHELDLIAAVARLPQPSGVLERIVPMTIGQPEMQ
jgi:hypothetical protein